MSNLKLLFVAKAVSGQKISIEVRLSCRFANFFLTNNPISGYFKLYWSYAACIHHLTPGEQALN